MKFLSSPKVGSITSSSSSSSSSLSPVSTASRKLSDRSKLKKRLGYSPVQQSSIKEEEEKTSEIYNSLQERIRKLENDYLVLQYNTTLIHEGNNHETTSSQEEEKKEDGLRLGLKRTNSVQFVAYRSYSPSFEENLRRARGNSIGNEAESNNNNETQCSSSSDKDSKFIKTEPQSAETDKIVAQQTPNTEKLGDNPDSDDSSDDSSVATCDTLTQKRFSLINFILIEILGEGQNHPRLSTKIAQETDSVLQDFLRIPMKLEKLLFFGTAVCVDSYLYVLTFLPIRFLWSLLRLVISFICLNKILQFHRRHFYYLQHAGIIFLVCRYVLNPISISMLYHWIRGQNMLKLYVLMGMVEVFDRLMCSFGQDALDSLYWNTTSRPFNLRTYISFLVVLGYASVHSLILFVHVNTLNVAMNSVDSALITILMSNNFAEIKSTVFKKYNKQSLFKITTSDICERFKLTMFLCLICLLNYSQGGFTEQMQWSYSYQCMAVFTAEIVTDWIKHSFITKFNFIKSDVYQDYALVFAGDITGIGHEMENIDHTHAVTKRVGLAQIPCVCVMLRFLYEAMRYWTIHQEMCVIWMQFGLQVFGILFFIKLILGFTIASFSRSIIAQAPPASEGSDHKKKQAVV